MDPTELPSRIHVDPAPVPDSVFVASGARVMGDVRLGTDCSIWYNAVVRGDINHIEIGARSNIQDGCIVHVTNAQPCVVGADVTVGHGVNLHACTVEDGCLIGMGAIVLSGAHIGRGSVVGAGAVVREDAVIEPFNLVVGVPARPVRTLPESTYQTHCNWAQKYVHLARAHGDAQ
ncbi:MAG: gamma carbonic anhydrase family protein [Candidatus Latescibacterota bacterium]